MTKKEKRELKDGVISIFKNFNILDHTATIGGLCNDILGYIDSLQDEPVSSVWYDARKTIPEDSAKQIICIKEDELAIATIGKIVRGTVKWAYVDDLLNLSNVERTVKDWKEMPVSEDLEEACEQLAENARKRKAETSSPFFSQTDYKQGVIDGAEWGKNQAMAEIQAQSMALAHRCPEEKTSEDLKKASYNALESISDQYDIISVGSCLEMFRLGAKWQKEKEYTCYEEAFEDGAKWKKEKIVDKACKWIEEKAARYIVDRFVESTMVVGIDASIIEDFKKDIED